MASKRCLYSLARSGWIESAIKVNLKVLHMLAVLRAVLFLFTNCRLCALDIDGRVGGQRSLLVRKLPYLAVDLRKILREGARGHGSSSSLATGRGFFLDCPLSGVSTRTDHSFCRFSTGAHS